MHKLDRLIAMRFSEALQDGATRRLCAGSKTLFEGGGLIVTNDGSVYGACFGAASADLDGRRSVV